MATPRDPAAQASPIQTAHDTPQLDTDSGAATPHGIENDTGSPNSCGETPENNEQEPERLAGLTSDPTAQGAVVPTAAGHEPPADTSTESETQHTRGRDGNNDHDDHDNIESHGHDRQEDSMADPGSDSAGNATLPVRTEPGVGFEPQSTSSRAAGSPSSTRQQDSPSSARFVGPDGRVVDLESIMYPLRSSSISQNTARHAPRRRSTLRTQISPPRQRRERHRQETPEFLLPRWQPDAEVTLCPICNTQFSIWVRKHHCRKCGRVVCNSCSPHRIIIPNQYIVRPPGSEASFASSFFADPMAGGYLDTDGVDGGERVRLCNPCVPDPNTAPPQSPTPLSPRSAHHRSRSSLGSAYGGMPTPSRYSGLVGALDAVNDTQQYGGSRTRSIALNPCPRGHDAVPTSSRSASYQAPFERYMSMRPGNATSSQFSTRPGLFEDLATSSRHRALPPTPQIAEEDECPVCHRELPATTLPDFETLREQHITACIQSHSTYGSPATPGRRDTAPPPVPRRSGMYTYAASEKDCVDDAECTICLEEFAVGVPMARLECLCRFHRACITAWFVNHPGRCPVHQHDGFGF